VFTVLNEIFAPSLDFILLTKGERPGLEAVAENTLSTVKAFLADLEGKL
jgi:hypothetical protein